MRKAPNSPTGLRAAILALIVSLALGCGQRVSSHASSPPVDDHGDMDDPCINVQQGGPKESQEEKLRRLARKILCEASKGEELPPK